MTKTKKNQIISFLLTAVLAVSASSIPTITEKFGITDNFEIMSTIDANAADGRKFNQNENQWKNGYYRYGKSSDTLYNAGCGIFALGNAVYALNGNAIDIRNVATWASKNGSWRPGSGGLYRQAFYGNVTSAYGARYGFKVISQNYGSVKSNALINHLKNGGVAVAHVTNHFIAVTGYNAKNSTYHIIESAVYKGRNLPADSWQGIKKLTSGSTNIDWFCLISNTGSSKKFARYTGGSASIVVALNTIGANSSFDYRTKIYNANNLSGKYGAYRGTAQQNTAMLNLLKQGNLIKP